MTKIRTQKWNAWFCRRCLQFHWEEIITPMEAVFIQPITQTFMYETIHPACRANKTQKSLCKPLQIASPGERAICQPSTIRCYQRLLATLLLLVLLEEISVELLLHHGSSRVSSSSSVAIIVASPQVSKGSKQAQIYASRQASRGRSGVQCLLCGGLGKSASRHKWLG